MEKSTIYANAIDKPIMTDVHDKKTRRYNMSRIKAKNTKPEILVRKFYLKMGFSTGSIIQNNRGNLTLFYPNTKP